MPVIVDQTPDMAAGTARLKLANAGDLDPATLETGISAQIDGVEKHLDPSRQGTGAWAAGERWFHADRVIREGAAIALDLGPSATWHLRPYQPYRIIFRDAAGNRLEDRMSWIALRLPSNPPPPAPERPAMAPEPESAPEEDPLAAFAELEEIAPEDPAPPPPEEKKSRTLLFVLLALGLLLALAILFWLFRDDILGTDEAESPAIEESVTPLDSTTDGTVPQTPPAADQRIPLTLEAARTYLKERKPEAATAEEEARRFTEAGQDQAAFLLRKYAAQKGSAEAAYGMAQYYDPASHSAEVSVVPAPDAEQAAVWYEAAAKGGKAEAMLRLGEMLKSGALDRPDGPEQSVFWLRKAAEAGNDKAKELLQ
jgi:hypothetical protein